MSEEPYRIDSKENSLRQLIFRLLDKNPLLTAKPLCKLLEIDYAKYKRYVWKAKADWKLYHEKQRGSNCCPSDVHAWRGFVRLPSGFADRGRAVRVGWLATKSRNHYLLFRNALGRMLWFQTGRVNLYVRKPAHLGKAAQLFADGFFNTGLQTSIDVFEQVRKSLKFKLAHFVFPSPDGQRLPKMDIKLFYESNGIEIKIGDRSHPNSVEVIAGYMNWAERQEHLLEGLVKGLSEFFSLSRSSELPKNGKIDYLR